MDSKAELDNRDWRLLEELQGDGRLSFAELGRRVGLSPPAVAERMRRLETAGVIAGYRVELDFEKVGLPITAIVMLQVTSSEYRRQQSKILKLPEIIECYHTTGQTCLIMKVAVSSVGHLDQFLGQLVSFGEPTTSVILQTPIKHRVLSRR